MAVGHVFHVINMQRIEDTFLLMHGIEITGAAIVFKHHAVGALFEKRFQHQLLAGGELLGFADQIQGVLRHDVLHCVAELHSVNSFWRIIKLDECS